MGLILAVLAVDRVRSLVYSSRYDFVVRCKGSAVYQRLVVVASYCGAYSSFTEPVAFFGGIDLGRLAIFPQIVRGADRPRAAHGGGESHPTSLQRSHGWCGLSDRDPRPPSIFGQLWAHPSNCRDVKESPRPFLCLFLRFESFDPCWGANTPPLATLATPATPATPGSDGTAWPVPAATFSAVQPDTFPFPARQASAGLAPCQVLGDFSGPDPSVFSR